MASDHGKSAGAHPRLRICRGGERTIDELLLETERKLFKVPHANTCVEYMYRDGGNYKFYGSAILIGAVTLAQIENYLTEGQFFIPEHVGLRSLVPDVKNDDDHMLHEFLSFEATFEKANSATPADIFIGLMKWNKENNSLWP